MIKKYIAILLLATLWLIASDVRVFVTVNPQEVYSGEEVEVALNIESIKRVKVDFPEINKIASFPVLSIKDSSKNVINESNSSQFSVVRITRSYTIMPTKSFTIDPIEVKINNKSYKSAPVKVKVIGGDKGGNSFLFRMRSNKKEVVVGEPFIVTVELIEPLALSGSKLEYLAPKFEGFSVATLGAGETAQKGNRVIRTIRYLLTANKVGKQVIEPATAKIQLQAVPEAQTPFAFFGTEEHWKDIVSNLLEIDVKELPKKVDLIGEFTIHESIDKTTTTQKKPVTYTIKISGRGTLDNIQDLQFSIPNVTIYAKDPKIEHIADANGIQSRYSREFVFISENDFTIPPLTITGYDTQKKEFYTLKSKSYTIHIKGSNSILASLSGSKESDSSSKGSKVHSKIKELVSIKEKESSTNKSSNEERRKIEDILLDKEYLKRRYVKESYSFATIILVGLLSFILGILATKYLPRTIAIFSGKKKEEKIFENYQEAMRTLYPHTTEDPAIEEMVKKLYEVLNGNPTLTIDMKELEEMVKRVKEKSA